MLSSSFSSYSCVCLHSIVPCSPPLPYPSPPYMSVYLLLCLIPGIGKIIWIKTKKQMLFCYLFLCTLAPDIHMCFQSSPLSHNRVTITLYCDTITVIFFTAAVGTSTAAIKYSQSVYQYETDLTVLTVRQTKYASSNCTSKLLAN